MGPKSEDEFEKHPEYEVFFYAMAARFQENDGLPFPVS